MKNLLDAKNGLARIFLASFAWLALLPAAALAQVPVDEDGKIIGDFEEQHSAPATGNEDIPLLSAAELEELVGPIALYPDDLLAIVLPAAAYPLQIVDAARFLEALENDPSLEPDPEWDDSVVALLNYPEVIELLNDDIDWTWRLGEAVVSQQSDLVGAIETFRDRAYAAGNLKSDSYQKVARNEGTIEITPVAEDVIYVPYYEPERVVIYQPRPVYYYYPRPYPVYYYPYPSAYVFDRGYFWGVTTAFTIGWYSDSLNVFHHSYYGHPYYGRSYWDRWWYRRPTRIIHNTTYVSNNTNITVNRFYGGDRWRPRDDRRDYVSTRRVTRNRHYQSPQTEFTGNRVTRNHVREQTVRNSTRRREVVREPISFRERPRSAAINRADRNDRAVRQDRNTRVDRNARQDRTGRVDRSARQDRTARVDRSARQDRTAAVDRNRPITRVTPRTQTAPRTRPDATRQPRRSEPSVQVRRHEPAVRAERRVETQHRARRAEPQRQVRQAEPRRQERAQRESAAAETRRSSERKSERTSQRRSSSRASERRR